MTIATWSWRKRLNLLRQSSKFAAKKEPICGKKAKIGIFRQVLFAIIGSYKEFTYSPDVELSSSAAERALKLGICTRHACMFIQSEDGAHAFADYQTIVNTCNLNRVPVQPYLMWLTANIRLRLLELQEQGRDDSTFFRMPHRNPSKDKDGNVIGILDMYDKSNVYCYDKIDTKGLAPYDYRRYLQSLQNS